MMESRLVQALVPGGFVMAAAEARADGSVVRHTAREAVAVFADYNDLVAAIEELELAGFDRAQFNLLTSCKRAERQLGHEVRDICELEDERQVPMGTWIDRHELAEGTTALAAGLAYVGSFAAIGVVVATGGELAAVIAAASAAGGASGALGVWVASAIGRRRTRGIEEQRSRGGLLLWVETHGPEQEQKAIGILELHSIRDVHLHDLMRSRSTGQALLRNWQPDPILLK
jgi:hypothetical protein